MSEYPRRWKSPSYMLSNIVWNITVTSLHGIALYFLSECVENMLLWQDFISIPMDRMSANIPFSLFFLENAANLKYFGRTLTDTKSFHAEVKKRLDSENVRYRWGHDRLLSRLPRKRNFILNYKNIYFVCISLCMWLRWREACNIGKNSYRVLVENTKGKRPLVGPMWNRRIILKWI